MSSVLKSFMLPVLALTCLTAAPAGAADMVRQYREPRPAVTVRHQRPTYVRRTTYVRRDAYECSFMRVDYRQRGYSENVRVCQPYSAYNVVPDGGI